MSHLFAVWLLPDKLQNVHLEKTIASLSKQFKTPSFTPHLTLVSGKSKNLDQVISQVKECQSQFKSITIPIEAIDYTEEFFKTLFIRFASHEPLLSLFSYYRASIPDCHSGNFMPHLSFLYKEMKSEIKQQLSKQIHLPFRQIRFDGIQLVSPRNRELGWYDITSWEVLSNYRVV